MKKHPAVKSRHPALAMMAIVALSASTMMGLTSCGKKESSQPATTKPSVTQAPAESPKQPAQISDAALMDRGMKTIRAMMKDPDAAQFNDVKVGEEGSVCGMVNGKNSYGGYVGYKPFFVLADGQAMIMPKDTLDKYTTDEELEALNNFLEIIKRLCIKPAEEEKQDES